MSTNVTWYDGVTYSVPAGGEINWPALSNLLIALGNKAAITTIATQAIRVAVTSPITVASASDCTVVSNLTVAGAVVANLGAGVDGRIQTIVDGKGDAATNNVTINRAGSDTINGATTFVLNKNRQAVTLQYQASTTDWKVIGNYFPAGTVTPADFVGVLPADKGGTGVSNNVAATTTRVGSFGLTETLTGVTSVTLPTTGTLATLAGAENLSNKTLTAPTLNTPVMGSYEDWTDQGSDPAAPGAGVTRIFTKAGIPYKKTATLPTTQIGGAASGGKNYLSASTSTAAGWASTGTATATTDTTAADLPEAITVGTGVLFTLGTAGNYSYARWTLDPADYNSPRIILKAAVKALASYASGNAKIEVYSNTASNYSGTSTRLGLSTDVSAVSAITTAQNYLGFYDNPGSSAPYMELRIVTVTATGTLCMSSISTGPGSAVQANAVSPPTAYTPTYAGFGTVSSTAMFAESNGPRVRVTGRFSSGTPTAVAATMTLPNSYTSGNTLSAVIGRWDLSTATASTVKTGVIWAAPNSNIVNFSLDDYTAAVNPFAALSGSSISAGAVTISVDFSVPVNELAGAVTNLGQNAVEYVSDDGTSDVYAPTGSLVPNQAAATGSTTRDFSFISPNQVTNGFSLEISEATDRPFVPASLYPFAQGNNGTSNNTYGMRAYFTSATVMRVEFGNQGTKIDSSAASAGSLPWSTLFAAGARFRVVKASAGQAVGFGLYQAPSAAIPQGAAGLVSGSGLDGRTDGAAVPTGKIGQVITFSTQSNTPGGTGSWFANGTPIATLPTGNWMLYGFAGTGGSTATYSIAQISTSTTGGTAQIATNTWLPAAVTSNGNVAMPPTPYIASGSSTPIYMHAYAGGGTPVQVSVGGFAVRIA